MADVLTVQDLEAAKKHDTFHGEVITGKAGAVSGGADIDIATNAVTGQVQTTLPKVLRDVGFKPASFTFVTGGTLGVADADKCIYNPAPAGDGNWYSWSGSLPHDIDPGTDPALPGSGYVPRTDVVLRDELTSGGASINDIAQLPAVLSSTSGAASVITSSGQSAQDKINEFELLKPLQTAAQVAKTFQSGSRPVISCYGDSTMWGATVGDLGTQDANNPPARLATALGLVYGGTAFTVNNRAISGTTLRQMLSGADGSGSTFISKISAGGVDASTKIIYCNHCINDSQLNGDIDQYREDLIYFVNICRENNKVPILVTANPNPQILIIDETKGKRLRYYVNTMRDVAEKTGCDLVDQNHYFEASYNYFRPDEIVPDGAHLSTDAYRQAGFNLAIPLVCCQEIGDVGDFSTLTNVTYFDNLSVNRQIQTKTTLRCGQILTATRPASGIEGVNYPVILSRGQKCISFIGLQWNDAANCSATNNDVGFGDHYQQKQFGNQSSVDWDSDAKFYSTDGLFAGLHVFGLFFNMSTPGLGSGLTFSGIGLPALTTSSSTGPTAAADPYTNSVVDAGDTLIARTYVDSTGLYFTDKSGSAVLVVRINGGVFTVDLYKNGTIVQTGTAGTAVTNGIYGIAIRSNATSVDVTLGILTVTLTTTTKLPNFKPYTELLPYHIVPTFGIS